MRGVEPLSIAALIGLIAFAIWEGRAWMPASDSHQPVAAVSPLSRNALEDRTPAADKRSSSGARRMARRDSADAAALPNVFSPVSSYQMVVSVPPPTLPERSSITAGTTATQLRDQYGEPALKVEKREGQLVEQYYYDSDQTHYVVVTLADGRVVSSALVAH